MGTGAIIAFVPPFCKVLFCKMQEKYGKMQFFYGKIWLYKIKVVILQRQTKSMTNIHSKY